MKRQHLFKEKPASKKEDINELLASLKQVTDARNQLVHILWDIQSRIEKLKRESAIVKEVKPRSNTMAELQAQRNTILSELKNSGSEKFIDTQRKKIEKLRKQRGDYTDPSSPSFVLPVKRFNRD